MRKLAVGLAIASVAMALLGGPARAQYPVVTLFLTPNPVVPGGTVTATLSGCVLGTTITLTVDGTQVAAADCIEDDDGDPTVTLTFTAPTATGAHTVTVFADGVQVASATLTVSTTTATTMKPATTSPPAAAAGGGGTGQLPSTGADSAPTMQIAAGVLVAGLALTGVALYRRRSPAAS